jgi:hypothetical protein
MKLPIAIAALFIAVTTALPAAAAAPTGHSFYTHGGRSLGLHHDQGPYTARSAYSAYAVAPRDYRPAVTSRGHCVNGMAGEASSAYPSWELCQ